MAPSDQTDAILRGIGLLAKVRDFLGSFGHWLKNDSHWNDRGRIEGLGDFLGIGGHLLQGFRTIEMLAASDKPHFISFQI
jgi:hypothetical protein